MFRFVVLCVLVAAVAAFTAPAATRPARMSMMFNFGKSASSAPKKAPTSSASGYQVNQGSANKGTYVPAGLTPEQYAAFQKKEAEAKSAKKQKFKIGKEPETLTEWMLKEKAKGNEGKGLLLKGHRMVKTKYDGWYTNESPV